MRVTTMCVSDLPGVTTATTAGSAPLLYMAANQNTSGLSESELQAQLVQLEKQYRLQEQVLSRQFEEQRRMLAHEQQSKMQDYIKVGRYSQAGVGSQWLHSLLELLINIINVFIDKVLLLIIHGPYMDGFS